MMAALIGVTHGHLCKPSTAEKISDSCGANQRSLRGAATTAYVGHLLNPNRADAAMAFD